MHDPFPEYGLDKISKNRKNKKHRQTRKNTDNLVPVTNEEGHDKVKNVKIENVKSKCEKGVLPEVLIIITNKKRIQALVEHIDPEDEVDEYLVFFAHFIRLRITKILNNC